MKTLASLKAFSKIALFFLAFLITSNTFAQSSLVQVSVNWPNWSSENRVEIYNPTGLLIATIDNGFTGGINNAFSTTVNLNCLSDGNNYSAVLFDNFGDGWNGNANITITTAGITVLNNSGAFTNNNGTTINFNVFGGGCTPITETPGGVTSNIELWLKANDGAGTLDGEALSTWSDQAKFNDANVNTPGQEPTFRDNPNFNVNFNAVVDFDNDFNTASGDFNYNDTSRDEMEGASGFYSDEIYVVVMPDVNKTSTTASLDIFCADSNPSAQETDATGIGLGRYSIRFDDEVLSYAHGTTPNGFTPVNSRGYGVAQSDTTVNYDNAGIINARHNNNDTRYELLYNGKNVVNSEVGVPQFDTVDNAKYWLGRSEGFRGSLDGRLLEVITYSARQSNIVNRNKIESYLAIKYGITLGDNGISQDYTSSDGTIIWDASANSGFNFDIAGIGRDDDSDLAQKQSKSVNPGSIVSLALTNTELTNNLNTRTFSTGNEFLVWGNNGLDMNTSSTSITVSLGPATVTTVTDVINRNWKIVETQGDDVGKVEVSVFESDLVNLPALSGNDMYVMLVSDDANFTTGLETVFLEPNTFNGLPTREGKYDFDGTKYFTIGIAHEEVRSRHLGFDGIDNFTMIGDHIDLAGDFTASAWVKTDGSNANAAPKTIVAKSDGTTGYKLFITDDNLVSFTTGGPTSNKIFSNTKLPDNVWHHVAVIYKNNSASIYIDGVLDNTQTIDAPTPNGSEFAIGAVYASKTNIINFFKGDLDEIRIWDEALTVEQLRYVMNQEIIRNGAFVNGTIIPNTITKNDIETINWDNLLAYYNMNSYIGTHLNDVSGNGHRGSLADPGQFTLEFQSSPLPYSSSSNGDWNTNTTWTNGIEQYIPGSASIVDATITIDWNIVKTNHDITIENATLPSTNNDNRSVLGLFVDTNKLTVNGNTSLNNGNGLTVTHYLNLDGKIDLQGESQLIQTLNSDLDTASSGTLERDQQGTQDLFTYNYWASPVGTTNNSTNNNDYNVPQVLNDGTNHDAPININFLTSGLDGNNGSPIGIADYWIWKFGNLGNDFYNWQHLRSTGILKTGEGYTMKGINNTNGNVSLEQNYVFEGKPNNGEVTLPINDENLYLVGNPYASALDADKFILDNPNTTGSLFFWEHFGGGSHVTVEYQGGYAIYNLSGATPAMQFDFATGGSLPTNQATKLPGRYITVAQGFFVEGSNNGDIVFNNGQRAFQKEGTASVFLKNGNANNRTEVNTDNRLKIRLGFESAGTYRRQLLVTEDNNATPQLDFGYDALNSEGQVEDMYWLVNNNKLNIQGINTIDINTILPLGLHTNIDGTNIFVIDELLNVPNDLGIYIYDRQTALYHDIKSVSFSIDLPAGEYLDRFELRFNNGSSLNTEEFTTEYTGIQFYFANNNESIVINNPELVTINSIELYNLLGQSVTNFKNIQTQDFTRLKTKNISTGNYILNINTAIGKISKKVLVE